MRKDATERRGRIIDSAARLFRERGYEVPLEDVAELAQVGRGTLYRNFADRQALALAVFDREMTGLEQLATTLADSADALVTLIRAMANVIAVNVQLTRAIYSAEKSDEIDDLVNRRDRVLEAPLRRARDGQRIREDFTIEDAFRAATMIAAPAEYLLGRERDLVIDEALAMLVDGIRPRVAA